MRRSIVTTRDLSVGHVISLEDLDVKRPGTGISPEEIPNIIGKKMRNAVKEDCIIFPEDVVL